MGKGDAWPAIRAKILAHDILIFGTPIWMGQISSVSKLCLEHRPRTVNKTAGMVAANAAHLSSLLRDAPYPG